MTAPVAILDATLPYPLRPVQPTLRVGAEA